MSSPSRLPGARTRAVLAAHTRHCLVGPNDSFVGDDRHPRESCGMGDHRRHESYDGGDRRGSCAGADFQIPIRSSLPACYAPFQFARARVDQLRSLRVRASVRGI